MSSPSDVVEEGFIGEGHGAEGVDGLDAEAEDAISVAEDLAVDAMVILVESSHVSEVGPRELGVVEGRDHGGQVEEEDLEEQVVLGEGSANLPEEDECHPVTVVRHGIGAKDFEGVENEVEDRLEEFAEEGLKGVVEACHYRNGLDRVDDQVADPVDDLL